jgi:cytochrome c oxidase subunit II
MTRSRWTFLFFTLLAVAFGGGEALAADNAPQPWQMDFRASATPVMEQIHDFHNLILILEVLIVLLVIGLMAYICVKFNAKANPVPSRTTHNTVLEIAWTVIPVLILVVIAIPSMRLLFFMDKAKNPEMTLKVTSHQWYWSYEYPDHGNFGFNANLIPDNELKPGQLRLLETDNRVVLPADTEIRVLVTSDDVIHNWAMPSFGIKMDTVPGRINETWMRVDAAHIGTYYGQCSELCGVNHAFMPITVDVVSKQDFQRWVADAKVKFAKIDDNPGKPVEVVDAGTR